MKYTYADLKSKYAKWDMPMSLSTLIAVPLLTWVAHFAFISLQETILSPLRSTMAHVITPDPFFFWIPALFVGIICSAAPFFLLLRLVLGDKAPEYRLYSNMKLGFDSLKILFIFGGLLGMASLVFGALGAHSYLGLGQNEIVVSKLSTLKERKYVYSDIEAIKFIPHHNANRKEKPDWKETVIEFKDGFSWSSEKGIGAEISEEEITFLIQHSGLTVPGGAG
jgi:hypothetical protein